MKFYSHAKWILSGEHSVIRGGKAIAFPLKNYKCTTDFQESKTLSIKYEIENSFINKLDETFIALLNKASELANIDTKKISGSFTISSNILMKSGLGSSAAICANIAKIFKYLGYFNDEFMLAQKLENHFHKISSGLDVAVAISENPIIFQDNHIIKTPKITFWPNITLTYSGPKLLTSNCSEIVNKMFCENENFALNLDKMMNEASNLCESGLENANFDLLKDGICLGNEVFKRWNLINDQLEQHMHMLKSKGAVATKPTGSGLGGFVIGLWESKPNINSDICLTLETP